MSSNLVLFVCGAITFLFVFGWFKVAAIAVFKLELSKNLTGGVWKKLLQVFFVDLIICISGVIGTGIIFVSIFNSFH
jgi:hypothetical protein